jgi:hypothetical protein
MMPKEQVCRHCEERFTPQTNKPGFIDECGCHRSLIVPPTPARKERSRLSELDKDVRFLWRNAIENLHVPPARAYLWIVNEVFDGKPPSNLLRLLGVQC